jgi:hypothetical protein
LTNPFHQTFLRVGRLLLFRPGRTGPVSLLAATVLATGATVATALPASASATLPASSERFAAAATPLQNKVLQGAMSRVPGGIRVSAGEVEWDGGRIAFGVSVSGGGAGTSGDSLTCTAGFFCAWGAANYTGTCWMWVQGDSGLQFDWGSYSGAYCGAAGVLSWQNRTPYRMWQEQFSSGGTSQGDYFYTGGSPSGETYCINPTSENPDNTSSLRTLGWIYTSGNMMTC